MTANTDNAMDNQTVVVRGEERELTSRVWQAAHESGVVIRSLAPSKNSLEEIFLSAVKEQPGGSA